MTLATEERPLADVAKYRMSFLTFLVEVVYILEPPPGRGRIRWEGWPYLLTLAGEIASLLHLVILKGRQLGLSWLVAAYGLWRAIFFPGAVILLMSQGQTEAQELLSKLKFIYNNLPDDLKPRVTKDNEGTFEFGSINSSVHALPSTEKAGSGFTASLVICDEHAKHPYAAANYAALEPTINAGAQFISVSTANGIGNFFHNLYKSAKKVGEDWNGFAWRFFHAQLRPGRDEAWYLETQRTFKEAPHLFYQEYPRDDDEAFVLTAGVPVFDILALEYLRRQKRDPIALEEFPLGYLAIYQEPIVGRRYVCGTDVSYGLDTPDAGCSQVVDPLTGQHVASLWGHFPPEELAERTVALCKKYGQAFLGVEANGVGEFCIRRLESLHYTSPDLLYHRDADEARQRGKTPSDPGWMTSANTTRPTMVAELREGITKRVVQTPDMETLTEMGLFVFNKTGKPEAAEGANDDRVMAFAIAWQMAQLEGMNVIVRRQPKSRGGLKKN